MIERTEREEHLYRETRNPAKNAKGSNAEIKLVSRIFVRFIYILVKKHIKFPSTINRMDLCDFST